MHRERLPYLLIPIAAFVAIIPLLTNGCSCGHDFDFHILSWMEAARQFTHGNLHPHWAYTPAYNAGEPRFVFYPPLSWTIGAILGLIFPWIWTPIVYTWLALTASGLALYYLVRDFTTGTAALIAATLYTVNPYMLFTAYERTAYAELLAAAWIPLLLHAILRNKVTIPRIAIPIALLWLTNAPAAVMSCYALALLTLIRVVIAYRTTNPGAPSSARSLRLRWASRESWSPSSVFARGGEDSATAPAHAEITNAPSQTPLQVARNTIIGATLGLGLAAFYILPAAYERRYVQIAMAIIPYMRIQDNFLFHHSGNALHDQVLHTASLIAVLLIAVTTIAIAISLVRRNTVGNVKSLLIFMAILTLTITLLLTPITSIIWNHAPELVFLQFPWRLLAILAAVLALSIAIALTPIKFKPLSATVQTIVITAVLTYPTYAIFHQTCDQEDTVPARLALFHSNKGTDPTDEYTPTTADNDSLAQTNSPYWLSPDPNAKAPANSQSNPAPMHLDFNAPTPEDLMLNLRDYPAWHITLNGTLITTRLQRDDGLIALPIPAGPATIDIIYAHTLDQTLGNIITTISLVILITILARPRKHIA